MIVIRYSMVALNIITECDGFWVTLVFDNSYKFYTQ